MHIAHFTTRRPVATAMVFLAVVLIGVVSFTRLPVNLLPDIAFPRLLVWTTYRDVGPAEIEEFVTIPVEEAVSTVPGVRRVHSVSHEGMSLVTVEFVWGTDMDFAALTLREKLDNLSHSLPREVERPVILRVDPRARPIMTLAVSGDASLHRLYTLARDVFKRRLEQIDGVAMAAVTGGLQREIRIEVDMQKLAAFGITLSQIEQALQFANDARPGGSIKKGRYRYALRTLGEFQSVQDIAETVVYIGNEKDGTVPVRLADIADIRDTFRERQGLTRYNGREAIGLLVTKESGANTVQVAGEVLHVIEQLRQQYPEVELIVVDNQAEFITAAIAQVRQALIYGALLAFLVLFFFLHDLRNPVNIALSMPISVIATFALMYFAGVSLNMVSLGGLALGVGMLVDNSIVVLENIFRREEEGLPLLEASVEGTREVSMAITASTLTTIAVFFPIIYIRGVAGQLFRDQSLTVAFSLLASLVVALALLPMIAARWQKAPAPSREDATGEKYPSAVIQGETLRQKARLWMQKIGRGVVAFVSGLFRYWGTQLAAAANRLTAPLFRLFDRGFERFSRRYESGLEWALNHPRRVLLTTLLVFVLSLLIGSTIDRRLMPEVEQGRFSVSVHLPPGTVLDATAELVAKIESLLQKHRAVAGVFSQIGLVEGDMRSVQARAGTHMAEIQVFLKPGFRSRRVMQALQPKLVALYPGAISLQAPQTAIGEILGTARADLEVQIRGNDADSAAVVMRTLRQKLRRIPGITQIFSSEEQKRPEIRLVIDREKAVLYDVPPRAVADFVQQVMHGRIATDFKDFDRKIPVLLRADERHRHKLTELLQMPLNHNGRSVPVSELVRLEQTLAPAAIEREDQVRQRSLFVSISGRGYNAVARDVENILQTLELPYGFQVRLGGQRQEMLESFREMVFAFVLAFVLVFMILAAQFESLVHPFVIIFTVPLAIIGVVVGLLVTGQSFNVMSLIGLVVLVGIVVNDAIVKVDFINQERRRSTGLRRAILLAGRKRLRPILMTTITTVLGLLPMAIGFGEGAELRRPLAIAIIFGLIFATVLTLIVVPVGYQVLAGRRE